MSRQATPVICLVEDDPIMGESLCDRFQLEGMAFDWHQTAAGAMAAIGSHSYAVVISDIRMPGFSGLDVLKHLRTADAHAPVVLITAFPTDETRRRAQELGAVALLDKPFDLEDLVHAVQNAGSFQS